jgi:hypothetical protein
MAGFHGDDLKRSAEVVLDYIRSNDTFGGVHRVKYFDICSMVIKGEDITDGQKGVVEKAVEQVYERKFPVR